MCAGTCCASDMSCTHLQFLLNAAELHGMISQTSFHTRMYGVGKALISDIFCSSGYHGKGSRRSRLRWERCV